MLHPAVYTSPSAGAIPPKDDLEKDLYGCNSKEEAFVVAYVSKMFAVPRKDLPEHRRKEITADEMRQRGKEERERRAALEAAENAKAEDEELNGKQLNVDDTGLPAVVQNTPSSNGTEMDLNESGEALIGFARLYSGTINRGMTVNCILPKYNAKLPTDHSSNVKHITTATIQNLYMMMGRELVPVEAVTAGNIFAIGGLEGKVLRNATICAPSSMGLEPEGSSDGVVNLAGVVMQAAPIVRVALEPENPADISKLVEGLRLLNQSDPCVEVLVQETGEHVILTAGELHLERCLRDLRERFAKCPISASEAIVPFRETAVKGEEMPPAKGIDGTRGAFSAASVSSIVSLRIRCALLPTKVTEFLQSHGSTINTLLRDQTYIATADQPAEISDALDRAMTAEAALRNLSPKDFWTTLSDLLNEAGGEWKGLADHVWAFGPKQVGPNLLIDKTGQEGRGLRSRSEMIANAHEEGKTDAEVETMIKDMVSTTLEENAQAQTGESGITARMLRDFDGNIETGFQLATYQGPLAAEPVVGMAYFVEEIKTNGEDESLSSKLPQVTGSLITAVREACRNGLLDWSPRMMLAMYTCDIQASTDVLGKVYAVVARRRGRIVSEEMKEGTSFFSIRALLPVVESFGFADEIRKRTSGAASPQLIFSG